MEKVPVAAPRATPEQLQSALDHSIWYLLSLWPALHVACSSGWGGPESSDKKDWFAGAISELLTTRPETDAEDLECFLLQIMQDEFDCNVEDETECEVAGNILLVRKRLVEEGTVLAAREVEERYKRRGSMKASTVRVEEVNQDMEEEEEEEGGDEDVDMDAPQLVPSIQPKVIREKPEPEIDEDGFEKVPSRRKR
jgi:pre-rRNA-processing protein TSR2